MVLTELKNKSRQRYFLAGITPNCFFIGTTLAGTVLAMLSGCSGLAYGLWTTSLENDGSYPLAFAIIFSQCLARPQIWKYGASS